jgi:homoserine O-succinyltransferase
MSLSLDEGPSSRRIPTAPRRRAGAAPTRMRASAVETIEIGLVNNMPDAALEQTERQFISLLNAGANGRRIRLTLFSLPEVVRASAARERVELHYAPIEELWDSALDGLIVTGTEPRASDLRDEPYWQTLAKIIDWAEANTRSTIWSCLGAHAAVLHMDGIGRHPLADKCFGVFDSSRNAGHALLRGLPARVPIPHSRWNELREEQLTAAGYTVLTRSDEAGVDMFARQGNSLFVFFQGHPEYEARTLLGEYRRDVRRFLRGERETYPSLPYGYFTRQTTARLTAFRRHAMADRREALMEDFPACPEDELIAAWRPAAERFIANWLTIVAKPPSRRRHATNGRASADPRPVNAPPGIAGGTARLAKPATPPRQRSRLPNDVPSVVVCGLPIAVIDRPDSAELMLELALARRGTRQPPYVITSANGQVISMCARDRRLRALFLSSDLIHADGMPLVFASRLRCRLPLPERVATTDLFHDVAARAQQRDASFYLLGATAAVIEKAAHRARQLYPTLKLVGARSGYFSRQEEEKVVAEINAAAPDILWIGMGVPAEQEFALRNRERLTNVGLIKTSGGLFDFLSGKNPRAPGWMQAAGLEWLYRALQEPQRLFMRYLATNPHALFLLLTRTSQAR